MILITGGAGVMGRALVRKLREKGKKIRIFTLQGDPGVKELEDLVDDVRYGDVSDAESVSGICDGVKTVYHLAAIIITSDESLYEKVNIEGTRNVVNEAERAGVKHFIHVSSASVVYPRPTPYSHSKRMAEEIVRGARMHYTIVRPTLVYDRERGGLEFDLFLDYLKKFPVIPFIGPGTAVKRPVFVEDIIAGLVALADMRRARGKTYNFSGGERITMVDFTRLCLRLMGMPQKRIIHVPVWMCRASAAVMEKTMRLPPLRWPVIAGVTQDADLDPTAATRDLGYHPAKVGDQLVRCFPRERRFRKLGS